MSSSGTILRDDALVTVTAGHLVADAQLALARDEHFDLLDNAGVDIVAAFDPIHRAFPLEFELRKLVLVLKL